MGQVVAVTMTPISIKAKINAAQGGTVSDPGGKGQVTLPPNALVTQNGKKYTGTAEVSVAIVDTSGDGGRGAVSGLEGHAGKDNGVGGKNPRKTLAAMWMGITAIDPEGEHNNEELSFDKEAACTVQLQSHNSPLGGEDQGHMLPAVHHRNDETGLWVPRDLPGCLQVDGTAVPPSQEQEPEDPFSLDPRYACEWRFLAEFNLHHGEGILEYADRFSFAPKKDGTSSVPKDPVGWSAECVEYAPPPPREPQEEPPCEGEEANPAEVDAPETSAAGGGAASLPSGLGEVYGEEEARDFLDPEPSGAPTAYKGPRWGWTQPLGEPSKNLTESYDSVGINTNGEGGYDRDQTSVLGYNWRAATKGVFLDPFGCKSQLGRGVFFRQAVPTQEKTALYSAEKMTETKTAELIAAGRKKAPTHRELRGLHWGNESAHLIDLGRCEAENKALQKARWVDGSLPEEEEEAAVWGATMSEYFAPEIEKDVVARLRLALPEAVVSRADVQRVLFVADYDVAKAADLLISDPTVVLRWKVITVVLRVKEALVWAQPYVHEYKAAFEAGAGEIETTVELLLKDLVLLRRNCEAEIRYRMQRSRHKGECFGHYTIALPTERELKKALDAVSPDTDAVVERLNFMPSMQERETQAQRDVLRKVFRDALEDLATSNEKWSHQKDKDKDELTGKRRPIQYSLPEVQSADWERAMEKSGALAMIGDHSMVDKFNTVRRGICDKIEGACMDQATLSFCSDNAVVRREIIANCSGANLIFPFKWVKPTEEDLQTVYSKCMPGNGMDLRDLVAKHKMATTMAMALWKLPQLVKAEVLGETRPRFEFTTPTEEELNIMYKQVVGTRVPGRNEITTTAAAIDKGLMKLPHIGPPENRGRMLKIKFGEVKKKLQEQGVIDYSYSVQSRTGNPSWEEFKAAFEGPGADNVDRTTSVCGELPAVLEREAAAKEALFWAWLTSAACIVIQESPHYVVNYKSVGSHIQRVFGNVSGKEGAVVPCLAECLGMMPKHENYAMHRAFPLQMEAPGLQAMLRPFTALLAEDSEVELGENDARVNIFWAAFNELSATWTRKTGRQYYVEEQPMRSEILEVMKAAVVADKHAAGSWIVEEYYKLRRKNFVAHFKEVQNEKNTPDGKYCYEMAVNTTGWWDVSMSFQAVLVCGIACMDGLMLGEATWDDSESRDQGYSGMMVESLGMSYTGSAQVPTMKDGSFQVMAQHSSTIHIKLLSEFAEEEFGPYKTDKSGAIMTIGRFNLVRPAKAWPTVLEPARGETEKNQAAPSDTPVEEGAWASIN